MIRRSRDQRFCSGRAVLALTAAVVFGACRPEPFPPDVVARYDGGQVELAEVQERLDLASRSRSSGPQGSEEPLPVRRARAAIRIVAERTWFERMTAERLAAEPALQRQLAALDRATLLEQVLSQGLGVSSLVSDAEVRQRYASLAGRLELPASYTLRHVYLRVDEGSSPADWAAARQEAERVRTLLLAPGADLDALIAAHSDSEDAITGGWIRRLTLGTPNVSRSFEEAVRELAPGEISAPVETRRGYQVLLLVNRNPARTLSFDEVRDQLVGQIVQERRDRRLAEVVAHQQAADPLSFDLAAFESGDPEAVVLRGRDSQLTLAELRAAEPQLASVLAEAVAQGTDATRRAVEALVQNQHVLAFGLREGIDRRPDLAGQRERRRREAIIEFVAGGLVRERLAAVSSEELERFYEDHKARFATPRRLHLRGLFLTHASEDLYATFARAEGLKRQLDAGAPLEPLVAAHSSLKGPQEDGDFGWVTHEDLAARGRLFHDTLVAAPVGGWIGPVKWEQGYAVVRVEGIEEPTVRPYEEVKAQVRRAYTRRQLEPIREGLEREAFAARGGELNPALTQADAETTPR